MLTADVLLILEDQMFLLSEGHDTTSLLDTDQVMDARKILWKEITELNPERDYLSASVLMRGLCNCMALLGEYTEAQCHSVDDFSCLIENILFQWSSTNSIEILRSIEKAVQFLVQYGQHRMLHKGNFTLNVKCHRCKLNDACHLLSDMQRQKGLNAPCLHYVKPFGNISHDQEELKGSGQSTKNDKIVRTLDATIGYDKRKTAIQKSREKLCLLQIEEQELEKELKKHEMEYCLNIGCYADVCLLILYFIKRWKAIEYFSPRKGAVSAASYLNSDATFENSCVKLEEALSLIMLSKQDKRLALETYDHLILDPFTIDGLDNKFLRHSILAKRFHLAHGSSPEDVLQSCSKRECLDITSILKSNSKKRGLMQSVMLIHAFNMWMGIQEIPKIYHLRWRKVEDISAEVSLCALYDNDQIGLYVSEALKLHGNYQNIILLLLAYLQFLYDTGICQRSPAVKHILK